MLVSEGAQIDIVDYEGRTPLHYCCIHGDIPTIELLLDKGADIRKADRQGTHFFSHVFIERADCSS